MKKSWAKGWIRRRPPPTAPDRLRIRLTTARRQFSQDHLAVYVRRRSNQLVEVIL